MKESKTLEEHKVEMSGFEAELCNLSHTAWEMARYNLPDLEKKSDFGDPDFLELCRKARKYLHLIFDRAIEKYEQEK